MSITDMQNSLRHPETQFRVRAKSWHTLNIRDLEVSNMLPEHRWASLFDLSGEDMTSSSDAYEVLYRITDIVLIICAVLFVVSAIVSTTLWIAGIILMDFVKVLW